MDLDALVTQQLNQNLKQQKSAVRDLLPKQQQKRSYADTQKSPQKLNLAAEKYLIDEYHGEWMMWYTLRWPGLPLPANQRNATPLQLKEFAKEFISLRSYPGEERYYKLKYIDKKKMQLIFDADKWIKDAIGSSTQRYVPPLSLMYRARKQLPGLAYVSASTIGLNKFLSKRFEQFLKNKVQKLKHKEFGFLKKYTTDLFNYSYSFRDNSFKASLKFSVVLASLAAYMIWKHKKDLSKSDIKSLQRKASTMKDVKHLDRYIKRL